MTSPRFGRVLAATLALGLAGCPLSSDRDRPDAHDVDAGPDGTGFPPPATDLTEPIGTAATLDLGTWNMKNFPCGNSPANNVCRATAAETPALAADIIASLGLDLVAVEEIADEAAFDELVQRLPDHEGVLSTDTYGDGTYQKLGFIYRASLLEASSPGDLFLGDENFPRPAFQVLFTWRGEGGPIEFFAVAVHLKAGEELTDSQRRAGAIVRLESYARNLVDGAGRDNIVVLGDFNDDLRLADGARNFSPFTNDPSRYTVRTKANSTAREVSFLPASALIDHIVTTAAFDAALGRGNAIIRRLDSDVAGFRDKMSDHLPVAISLDP